MGRREDIARAAKLAAERAKSGGSAAGGAIRRGGDAVGGAAKRGGGAVGGAAKRGGDAVGAKVKDGRDAGGAAITKGKQAASTTVDKSKKAASSIASKGAALSADLAKKAMLVVPQRLDALGTPTLPLESRWGMGFGEFLSGIDGVPQALRPTIAGRLDKVGSIFVSPTGLDIDGEAVEWRSIKAITLGSPTDAMSARAATELVEKLRAVLPRFPGRTFVMRQAAEFAIALCLVGAQPRGTGSGDEQVQVVTSIRYAGKLRQKELRPGLFAILLSSMKPDLATAVVETSRPFGTVVKVDPARRAAARAAAVHDLVSRIRKQVASEPDDD